MPKKEKHMLEIENLCVCFSRYVFGLKRRDVCAIQSLDVNVQAGRIMAVVGQSGAGKSLLAHALLGILPANAHVTGTMRFKGNVLTPRSIVQLRGKEIALIPQSIAYLNPLLRVGTQIARSAKLSGIAAHQSISSARQALARYGLNDSVSKQFPFELSGGMAKRVLTATATVGLAELIVADEPTNGLDAANTKETLTHLRELADLGKAVLLITHDLTSALTVADDVTIFYGGVTVEECTAQAVASQVGLQHPYSQALWAAVPENGFHAEPAYASKPQCPPSSSLSEQCPFCYSCSHPHEECFHRLPMLRPSQYGRVRCHHA